MHLSRGSSAECLDDEVDAVLLTNSGRWHRQIVAIETGRSVDMVGDDQRFQNRPGTSREHRDIGAARKLENLEHVDDGMIESNIAGGGYKAENLKGLRRRQHHHDRGSLILSWVGGDNNLG